MEQQNCVQNIKKLHRAVFKFEILYCIFHMPFYCEHFLVEVKSEREEIFSKRKIF